MYYLLVQAKVNKDDGCDNNMLTFIKCGSFVIESISYLESIFNSLLAGRWCKNVQKISTIIR